jgi:hypothetical protein
MIRIEAATRLQVARKLLAGAEDLTVDSLVQDLRKRFNCDLDKQRQVGDEQQAMLVIESPQDRRDEILGFLKGKGLTRVGKMNGIIDVYPPKWGQSRIKIVRLFYERGLCSVEIKGQDELVGV